ncbi:amidase [Phaeobacter sp. J2-8]|uniref:amidase n=1 Tax=Phaeobacter sp. J2-8 TaxID=2931394 RepID=UPI001FD6262F|nr:amidase [Phaeobacter sp. J2-8]MCJ7872300.1 amidase [Phaeobacter sp. J2-8]
MDILSQGATGIVAAAQSGRLKVAEIAEAVLARIAVTEPSLHAWAYVDPAAVRARAAVLDAQSVKGPLHGLPIGVKDLMDTADMPTEYGSSIYRGWAPTQDAEMIARLRKAGALLIGKTTTTEFACFQPTPTTNPHNAGHTPGGSSSGSAAAVSANVVPVALGSQTAASITRPASYCGVVGYKSSHRRFPLSGIKGLAPSFDSFGWLAKDVGDAAMLFAALDSAVPPVAEQGLRIAICQTPMWAEAEHDTRMALQIAGQILSDSGHLLSDLVLPDAFEELTQGHIDIMSAEAAGSLSKEMASHPTALSQGMFDMLESGASLSRSHIQKAQDLRATCIGHIAQVWNQYDCIIAPSAPGEAPESLDATGSPIFSRLWTSLGLPSIAVPVTKGANGLPVGVQILGPGALGCRAFRAGKKD